ncbi:MAG: cytochrome c family protein [Acidobacteriia bacterium]|nr:cytochrome c family protein [Terriglobia bacterium]
MATEERVRRPGWWPTKGTFSRSEYLGPETCAECHASEAEVQQTTPMAHAGARARDSKILRAHERLSFHLGPYVYDIARTEDGSAYSVSDGRQSVSVPLGWAFGEGEVGQTYLFERKGIYYEGRLSFFPGLQALDITAGHPHSVPLDLEAALGRQMGADETQSCFGCHTTASTTGGRFDPEHLFPGVACEACHGPGAKHAAAIKAGKFEEGSTLILNPAHLDPVDLVDFCGACHRTWADVSEAGTTGVVTARFPPYRLESSRCWGKGDARLTCLACHDPHQPLPHDPRSYDERCLRCHLSTPGLRVTADHPGKPCPESTKNCVTCHMPKYEVPDTHTKYTDHWIRIVRSDTDYPD